MKNLIPLEQYRVRRRIGRNREVAEPVAHNLVGYREEQTAPTPRKAAATRCSRVGVAQSITDRTTCSYPVDAVGKLGSGSENVSSHRYGCWDDDTGVGLDGDVPGVERVYRANVHLHIEG